MRVRDIREIFREKYINQEFVIDRSGSKTLEILGASFLADEPTIFGELNLNYINKELDWYESQSLNIYDLDNPPPKAWIATANKDGEINSNYGYLIFSKENGYQYDNALAELKSNPNSRRACMIYTRPTMWSDYCENGKNDFVCTNAHHYYIRDNELHVVVSMRSNDSIFGYKNDLEWARYVLVKLASDLKVNVGEIYWQVANLHIYERHFNFLEN